MNRLALALLPNAALAAASASAMNLGANGGLEAGNSGCTRGYSYVPQPPTNACCGGLWPEATCGVGGNAHDFHALFTGGPQSGAEFEIVNGAGTSGVKVWEETGIAVAANTTCFCGAWVSSVNPGSPAQLAFSSNGALLGATISPGSTTGGWTLFLQPWNSGAATSADIALVNQNTTLTGNDFGVGSVSLSLAPPVVPAAAAPPDQGATDRLT